MNSIREAIDTEGLDISTTVGRAIKVGLGLTCDTRHIERCEQAIM